MLDIGSNRWGGRLQPGISSLTLSSLGDREENASNEGLAVVRFLKDDNLLSKTRAVEQSQNCYVSRCCVTVGKRHKQRLGSFQVNWAGELQVQGGAWSWMVGVTS